VWLKIDFTQFIQKKDGTILDNKLMKPFRPQLPKQMWAGNEIWDCRQATHLLILSVNQDNEFNTSFLIGCRHNICTSKFNVNYGRRHCFFKLKS
jgi:hypothetical protein